MSIFYTEPQDQTPPDRDVLWTILAVALAAWAGAALLPTTTGSIIAAITASSIVGLLAWALSYVRVRWRMIRIQHDVSASSCHRRFLALALHICASRRRARRHWQALATISEQRRHPNRATYAAMNELIAGGITRETLAETRLLLQRVIQAKDQARTRAKRNVHAFLSSNLREGTLLVLYGFSTAICDAITSLVPFPACDIIIVKDRQYGEDSQREHQDVAARVQRLPRRARVIDFSAIGKILDVKQTASVTDLDGSTIKLSQGRRVIAVIGCESYAVDGTVLIPSKTDDPSDDTSTFLGIVRQAAAKARKRINLVVVGESYKLQQHLTADDLRVATPFTYSIKNAPRLLRFLLTGKPALLSKTVQLVRIPPNDLHAIIDDNGIHDGEMRTLPSSLAEWTRYTRSPGTPADLGFTKTCDIYIFDMNGVLANDEHDHYAAFAELVRQQNGTLTPEEYKAWCLGRSDEEGIDALKKEQKLLGHTEVLAKRKQEYYLQYSGGQTKPYPGAVELINLLITRGKRVYLLTASSLTDATRFLTATGLAANLSAHTYAGVPAAQRAAAYAQILNAADVPPYRVAVVDDSPANLDIAQALGLRTIGVKTTRPHDVRAEQLVTNVRHLYELIVNRSSQR